MWSLHICSEFHDFKHIQKESVEPIVLSKDRCLHERIRKHVFKAKVNALCNCSRMCMAYNGKFRTYIVRN